MYEMRHLNVTCEARESDVCMYKESRQKKCERDTCNVLYERDVYT